VEPWAANRRTLKPNCHFGHDGS